MLVFVKKKSNLWHVIVLIIYKYCASAKFASVKNVIEINSVVVYKLYNYCAYFKQNRLRCFTKFLRNENQNKKLAH